MRAGLPANARSNGTPEMERQLRAKLPRRRGAAPSLYTRLAVLLAAAAAASAAFTCAPQNDAAQCAALGALYASTSGAGWSDQAGWATAAAGSPTDYCTFSGVSCDTAPDVSSLQLSSNGLVGTLPDALGALTALTVLQVDGNTLSGTVPAAVLSLLSAARMTYTPTFSKLWPQLDNAILEGASATVSSFDDIRSALSSAASTFLTTFVLQQHIDGALIPPSFFSLLPQVDNGDMPYVLVGNASACLAAQGFTFSDGSAPLDRCTINMAGAQTMAISKPNYFMDPVVVLRNLAVVNSVPNRNTGKLGTPLSIYGPVVVIEECVFVYNTGTLDSYGVYGGGGGLAVSANTVIVRNTVFTGNYAQGGGGAISIDTNQNGAQPVLLLYNCTITQNMASKKAAAISVASGARLVTVDTTFAANFAWVGNGAISVASGATAELVGCTFANHAMVARRAMQANASSLNGAVIYVAPGGNVSLTGCQFYNNSAGGNGGALYADSGAVVSVVNSSFLGNRAGYYYGGAIYAFNATQVSLSGSVLSGNGAQAGGAVAIAGGALAISNTLLADNAAVGASGQGGCVAASDYIAPFGYPAVSLVNATFRNCSAQLVQLNTVTPGALYSVAYGSGGGGLFMTCEGTTPGCGKEVRITTARWPTLRRAPALSARWQLWTPTLTAARLATSSCTRSTVLSNIRTTLWMRLRMASTSCAKTPRFS